MKNLKISAKFLAIAMGLLALSACEKGKIVDIDVEQPALNTAAGVTVSMTNATQDEAEDQFTSGSTFTVPVTITGNANGAVRVKFEIRGYGEHPAAEFTYKEEGGAVVTDGYWIVTSREVTISPENSGRGGIEISTYPDGTPAELVIPYSLDGSDVPDDPANVDHQFEVVIVSAEGAEVDANNKSTIVTLLDNDKPGTWTYIGQGQFQDVIFTGATVRTDMYMMHTANYLYYRLPFLFFDLGILPATQENIDYYVNNYYGFLINANNSKLVIIPEQDTGIGYALLSTNDYFLQEGYTEDDIINGTYENILMNGDNLSMYNIQFLGQAIFSFPAYSMLGYEIDAPDDLMFLNGSAFDVLTPSALDASTTAAEALSVEFPINYRESALAGKAKPNIKNLFYGLDK